MIYKFRILSDEVDDFVREIAIDSEATFLDLNKIILESVDYASDQMTSFFTCNDNWEKETEITLIEMDNSPEIDSWIMEETPLSEFIEDEGQKLLFVFDYLTERAFFLDVFAFISGKTLDKPKILLAEGNAPPQLTSMDNFDNDAASKITLDDTFYGDQDFDINELDAEGFSGLDAAEEMPDSEF